VSETCWQVRERENGLEVPLHVQVRARRDEIAGVHNGVLKIRISAPPVDDAANRAVLAFFASLLSIPKSRLRIVSGQKSRDKVLRIEGISLNDLRSRLP
jgi:uncharacterized protein (TIGR00251 family)